MTDDAQPRRDAPKATRHARAVRAARLAAAVTWVVAALVGGVAGPAAAHPRDPVSYVALGDSYASGFGAGSYVNACGQSPLGLPGILDGKKRVDLVADATCAGAKLVTEPGGALDLPEQAAQATTLHALTKDTDLATISAGGNDVGFGEVAAVCASQPTAVCSQVITARVRTLPALADDLDALYGKVHAAAPNATVVVTGYPHLFSPEFGNDVIFSSPEPGDVSVPLASQEAFNTGTDALNAIIRSRAEAYGFVFVDVVPAFESHGLGSRHPWITFQPGAVDNLHPTAKGYRSGYLRAVRSAVDFSELRR